MHSKELQRGANALANPKEQRCFAFNHFCGTEREKRHMEYFTESNLNISYLF